MVKYKIYSLKDEVLQCGNFDSNNEKEQRKFFETFIDKFENACYMVFFEDKEYKGNHFVF